MDVGQALGELRHHPLRIPQGGGVGGGDHYAPVRPADCQAKALSQPRWGVHKDVIVLRLGLSEKGAHPPLRNGAVGQGERGGEEKEIFNDGMLNGGPLQCTAALQHVGKVHQGAVGHAQRDIQIAQADVHVDAEDPVPQGRQTGRDAAGERGFSGAPLARRDHDCGAHSVPPVSCGIVYHKDRNFPIVFVQNV